MSIKSFGLGLGIAVAVAGMAGQAMAGPHCNTGGGARYGMSRVSAVQPVAKPRQASVSPVVVRPMAAVGGGDGEVKLAVPVKKAEAGPKTAAPVVAPQPGPLPVPTPAPEKSAAADEAPDNTSVSGVAARLAALAAQQVAAARKANAVQ